MSAAIVGIGSFTTDQALVIRTWDASLAAASGIAAETAIGRRVADVLPSAAERGLLSRFDEIVASGVVHVFSPAIHHYLVPCPPANPSRRFTQMQQRATAGPLRDGDQITGVIVAIEDVTARVDAERDLAESLAAGRDDWAARRAAVQRVAAQEPTADFAAALVEVVGTHHRDFDILSSALQLLAGTDVDVSPSLARLLRDDDVDLRIQAALALGGYPTATAEEALIAALGDRETNVRFQAIESLGRLRSSAAVPRLADLAEGSDPFIAFAAVDALAAIDEPSVAPRLLPLLERDELSSAVAEALGSLGDATVVDALVHHVNRSAAAARAVTIALDRIFVRLEGTPAEGQLVAARAAAAITPQGEAHVVSQSVMASDADLPAFTRVLSWIARPSATEALVRLLTAPAARDHALAALVARGESSVSHLIPLVADRADDVARLAVIGLGLLGSRAATPALLQALETQPSLVGVIVGALARLADPAAFEPLLQLLAHPDADVRQAAIGALNGISHPEMPQRVQSLLTSEDARLRESAVRIAGYFGYPGAADGVLALTQDRVESVRSAAFEQLPFLDADRGRPHLLAALAEETPDVRAVVARALARVPDPTVHSALATALQDEWWWVRYYAARSLAEHRHPAPVAMLLHTATTDVMPPVRIACIEALAIIAPHDAAAAFIELAAGTHEEVAAAAVEALAVVSSPRTLEALVAATRDARSSVQLAGVKALARHDTADAVATLQSVAVLGSGAAQRAAIDSLAVAAACPSPAGDLALQSLVGMLTDGERADAATAALSRLPVARLVSLGPLLRRASVPARRALVEIIGRSRTLEATTLLMDALTDEAPLVRDAAARRLERRRDRV